MIKTAYYFTLIYLILSCQNIDLKNKNDISLIETAKKIHSKVIVLDTHNDIDVYNFSDSINYSQNTNSQVNLPKMIKGGLDVSWLIVYTGQGKLNKDGYKNAGINAQNKFDAINRLVNDYASDKISLATSSKEVDSIIKLGKKVAMIGVENAYPIGEDLNEIKRYAKLGARYMSLAHNGHNQFSDSNTGEFDNTSKHNGISELGKKAIDSMNYYGIMVDISHPSKEAIRQTIKHSKAPVIASHSSARALSDHPRNLDDEQLLWVKENGGVVQTVALALFVNKVKHEKYLNAIENLEDKSNKEDLEKLKKNFPQLMYQILLTILTI